MGGQAGLLRQIDVLFNAGAPGHLPDAELLRRFVMAGREDAERSFEALVDRHGPMVMAVCRRSLRDPADAQDAFQATFLVLSRKAGRIGRPERLASWLYGVASRTSMKARAGIARRRRHERIRAGSVAEGHQAIDDSEIRAVLHEEIARLPEKYRAPVVLCHLEGMTRERASAHLRCPEGTVGVRLMRARERLRIGLARRGFAVAAGGLSLDLGIEASAALHPALAASTASAAAAFASGQNATAGAVPARTITLTRRVLRTMFIERLLLTTPALVLAAALAAGAGLLASKAQEPAAPPTAEARPAAGAASPWKKVLDGGPTVELIGVAADLAQKDAWWTPSGSSLTDPPFDSLSANVGVGPGLRPRVFAVRVTAPLVPDTDLHVTWDVPGSSASGMGTPKAKGRPLAGGIRGATFYLPEGLGSATLRFGVASGPWAVLAGSEGKGIMGIGIMGNGVVFSRARAIEGRSVLAISEDVRDRDVRIVAIDRDGVEHAPASHSSVSAGSARLHDVEFALTPDKIREIQVQTRPYEWAEFQGVALDPAPAASRP